MTDTIDVAALVEMVLGRIGSTYDDEAHLSGEEARQLAAALQSQADALAEARRQWRNYEAAAGEQFAARSTAEASLATMREALGELDAEDVRNMRDLMLKAERFYFGKAPDGEDVYVASRGPGKWVVSNGGAFVIALDGHWVMEPMPSSRTEEFIAATRRTFADAVTTARAALAKEGK